MNETRLDKLCDRLDAAVFDDVVDRELFIHAKEALQGCAFEIANLQQVISHQIDENVRLRASGPT